MIAKFTKVSYDPERHQTAPASIWDAIERDGQQAYWQRIDDKGKITLPEYIEGNAKGTIKQMYGCYYRKITVQR